MLTRLSFSLDSLPLQNGKVCSKESAKQIDLYIVLRCSNFYGNNLRLVCIYGGRLQSSWTRLITPSPTFVQVRWRYLFRSTSLGMRCTSYNAPPTSRKRAADRWSLRNFLPGSSLFVVGKAQKSHGGRSELNSVLGLEKVDRWDAIRTSAIQSRHKCSSVCRLCGSPSFLSSGYRGSFPGVCSCPLTSI
jgi:hypothetical protein